MISTSNKDLNSDQNLEATKSNNLNTSNTEEVSSNISKPDISISAYHDIKRRFGNTISSALGPGATIEGGFCFDEPICIDGRLNGEIKSDSFLIVGEQAEIYADIEVAGIIILGKVSGKVKASEFIEIRSGGELDSNIYCPKLIIEDGAYFNGTVLKPSFKSRHDFVDNIA